MFRVPAHFHTGAPQLNQYLLSIMPVYTEHFRCTGEAAGALGQQELTLLNVELGESTSVVETYRSLRSLQAELEDVQSLADGPDQDLRQLAAEEKPSLLAQVSCKHSILIGFCQITILTLRGACM